MGGATDLPQRSSSPLKRRASSMEPDADTSGRDDVDMVNVSQKTKSATVPANTDKDVSHVDGAGVEHEEQDVADVSLRSGSGTTTLPVSTAVFALKEGVAPEASMTLAPNVEEQVKLVQNLHIASEAAEMKEGEEFFLVSTSWLYKFYASGGDSAHQKRAADGPIGPIDNSDIVLSEVKDVEGKRAVRLKPDVECQEDFVIFSEKAWTLLVGWYGLAPEQIPIRRVAHNTSPSGGAENMQVEFHPPVFTLHRVSLPGHLAGKTTDGSQNRRTAASQIQCPSSYGLMAFWREAKRVTGIPMTTKTRFLEITFTTDPSTDKKAEPAPVDPNLATPPDTPERQQETPDDIFSNLFIPSADIQQLPAGVRKDVLPHKDETGNEKYNGSMRLEFVNMVTDKRLILDEQIDQTKWASTLREKNSRKSSSPAASLPPSRPKQGNASLLSGQGKALSSGRSSPAPRGPVTRGRAKRSSGRTIGCVGLNNLGNSCYMNSALQCIRSVEELTKYFLVRESDKEINRDNALGYNGDTALAYGHLLHEIYHNPAPSSVAPRSFKNIIGRYNPTFSGYGQQDSQEFVNFLLDGLREDLNRVLKKPYIEVPDSTDEMIGNPAAIRELGEKVWAIGKERDDSVIHDLFTGMYRSSLVCPVCDKHSLVFETFNSLTLPLPVKGVWSREAKYFPLNDQPIYLDLEVDRDETLGGLKKFVSGRVGVPAERLMVAEVWKDKFYKYYEDDSSVNEEVTSSDTICIYELDAKVINPSMDSGKKNIIYPKSMCDVDTPAKNGDDSESSDKGLNAPEKSFVVPVYHRLDPSDSRRNGSSNKPPPHFISVTQKEAFDLDTIQRKVLEKMITFSKWPSFHDADEDSADEADPVMVATTSSDADSSGEGRKVVARSVESEEDIVDVTMKDAAITASPPSDPNYPELLRKFSSRRPKWIDPKEFLSPDLQNLFSMSYFPTGKNATSYNSNTEYSSLPSLESRMPAPPAPALSDVDMRSPGRQNSDSDSSNEDIPAEATPELTRMADESDEDEDLPPISKIAQRARPAIRAGGGARRGGKTYGKRARAARRRGGLMSSSKATSLHQSVEADSPPGSPSEDCDGGPLIRPGEGIMISWSADVCESVFAQDFITHNPSEKEVVVDPKLNEKRKARNFKKKNGVTLNDCLDSFEKEETLSESNEWYCPRCKEHRQAKKKMVLWKTPDILVIHLKRFSSAGYRRDKLDMLVNFPIDGLDIGHRLDETSAKSTNEIYDLIAVDDHWGGLNGGHYTAYAKNFVDGEWYDFNDSSVHKVDDTRKLISTSAYLLFYRRRSDEPLGGERYKEILARYDAGDAEEDEEMLSDSARELLGGKSSALKGKGVALSHLDVDREDDSLPSYQQASGITDEGIEIEDAEPSRGGIGYGSGIGSDFVRSSIEQDEAKPPWESGVGWSFGALDSGQGATAEGSEATNVDSLDPALGDPGEQDLTMTSNYADTELQFPNYDNASEEVPPPPEGLMEEISTSVWDKQLHEVPAGGIDADQASDKAVSIHVDDSETMD